MKRLLLLFAFCAFGTTFAFSQTLADAAREQQAKKKPAPAHVYTNESMEFHPAPADTKPADKSNDTDSTAKSEAKSDDAAASGDNAETPDPAAEKKKAADAIKDKYAKQQAEVTTLERELDILVRENRMRAATYYSDAGNRLRDEAKYAADDRKYQADIDAKQKAIADGKANLDKIREEARRAGVPLS